MIQLSSVGKHFGSKTLFEGLNWVVGNGERVGLVGANGTGKSTLLKMLAGLEGLDYGDISFAKGITTGYLPQDGLSLSGRTVFAECMTVFADLRDMEKELEALTHKMAELDPAGAGVRAGRRPLPPASKPNSAAATAIASKRRSATVLTGLGFSQRRLDAPHRGVLRRLADAHRAGQAAARKSPTCCCSTSPPTTSISKRATGWKEYLHDYPERLRADLARPLLSGRHRRTHRRALEQEDLHFYTGNYDALPDAEERAPRAARSRLPQPAERIEQLEAFINRFRYQATKAKQVQSRIKELEKIERIEIPPDEKTIHFSFPQPKPSGRDRGRVQGRRQELRRQARLRRRQLHHRARRPHRAGRRQRRRQVDADQAAGRRRAAHRGRVHASATTSQPDYFAQDQYKELDPERAPARRPRRRVAPRATQTELRSLLGCFLFSDDDVFKRSACSPAASATATRWRACC